MAFDEIINKAPEQHLKPVLQALANADYTGQTRNRIHSGLGKLDEYRLLPRSEANEDDDDESTSSSVEVELGDGEGVAASSAACVGNKRKRDRDSIRDVDRSPALDICQRVNCRRVFIPGEDEENETNTEESCQFHPGDFLFDKSSDAWEGWVCERDGAMDSMASREDNPLGFMYECCGETGDDEDGCSFDRHLPSTVPEVGGLKKQRIM